MKKSAQDGNAARPGPAGVRPALPLRLHRPWENRAVGAARRRRRGRPDRSAPGAPEAVSAECGKFATDWRKIHCARVAESRLAAPPRALQVGSTAPDSRSPRRPCGMACGAAADARADPRRRFREDRCAPPGAAPGAPAARRSRAPRGSGRCAPGAPGWPGDSPSNAPRARPCKALRGFERPAAGRGFRSRRARRSRAAAPEGPLAGGLTQRPDSCSGTPGG